VRTASCAVQPLLDYYFVRKEKRSGAVIELHQEHAPVEIIYFTQDAWLFAESTATLVVIIFLPLRFLSGIPATITLTDILASFGPNI
jgi:hypothetical protein